MPGFYESTNKMGYIEESKYGAFPEMNAYKCSVSGQDENEKSNNHQCCTLEWNH